MQKHTLQNKKTTSGISTIKENESSKLIRTIIKKFVFRFKLSTNEIIKNNDMKLDRIIRLDIKNFFNIYLAIIIYFIKSKLK